MTDITIVCSDGGQLRAHWIILLVGSEYFKAMRSSGMKDSHANKIHLNTIDTDTMQLVLNVLYFKQLTSRLTFPQLRDLFIAADYLCIHHLYEYCSEYLSETIDRSNCQDILWLGKSYNNRKLISSAIEFLCKTYDWRNGGKVFCNLDFQSMELVLSCHLTTSFQTIESTINLICDWVACDETRRIRYLPSLCRLLDSASTANYLNRNPLNLSHDVDITPHLLQVCTNSNAASKIPKVMLLANDQIQIFNLYNEENFVTAFAGHVDADCSTFGKVGDKVYFLTDSFYDCSVQDLVSFNPNVFQGAAEFVYQGRTKRYGFTMAALSDCLYLVGGDFTPEGKESNLVEKFNVVTREWTKLPDLISPRWKPVVTEVDGSIYVFGGTRDSDGSGFVREVEKYAPDANKWTEVSVLPKIWKSLSVAPFLKDSLLVMQDENLYRYDLRENKFVTQEVPKWITEKSIRLESSSTRAPFFIFSGRKGIYRVDHQLRHYFCIFRCQRTDDELHRNVLVV